MAIAMLQNSGEHYDQYPTVKYRGSCSCKILGCITIKSQQAAGRYLQQYFCLCHWLGCSCGQPDTITWNMSCTEQNTKTTSQCSVSANIDSWSLTISNMYLVARNQSEFLSNTTVKQNSFIHTVFPVSQLTFLKHSTKFSVT